jgi:hypothetical protein
MKKLLLLLLFIPLVSFGQDFSNIKDKIKYIKNFKSWEHFLDHFETREQVYNFFGKPDADNPSKCNWECVSGLYGWKSKEDYVNYLDYYELTLDSNSYSYGASSSSSGNISHNSTSNSLDYNGSTTYSEGGSYSKTYDLTFEFKVPENRPYIAPHKRRISDIDPRRSNKVLNWDAGYYMKGISDRTFIRLIKNYFSKTKKKDQFKRKKVN